MNEKRVLSFFISTPVYGGFPHWFQAEYKEKSDGKTKISRLIPGTLKDLRPLTDQEITVLDDKKGWGYLIKIRSDRHY